MITVVHDVPKQLEAHEAADRDPSGVSFAARFVQSEEAANLRGSKYVK